MKRTKHNLSSYKLLTCDMGKLIPIGLTEVLPGDTMQQSTSLLLRMSPMVAPVMHPVQIRVHHWFVPNRIIFDGWEDFITGGKDGTGSTEPYPTNNNEIQATVLPNSLLDYMGLPTERNIPAGAISLLPILAYNAIYNEFYRDQDLAAEVSSMNLQPLNVAWEKDYFTTARPWSQKGPAISLPLGERAVVRGLGQRTDGTFPLTNQQAKETGGVTSNYLNAQVIDGTANATQFFAEQDPNHVGFPNFYADLSTATGADIIDIRRAFALQRYQEARAMYGSRYTEYLRYLGITPSDARLQRPEFLGGGKQTISFSEVLKTGSGEDPAEPIGTMKGHGIAAMRSNRYRYYAEEHGYVLSLLSIRPKTIYQDGINKTWSRRTKEDYYQRELELIGQQEIYNREIYAAGTAADAEVFGYQDRYSDYRQAYSNVTGEFRNLLDYWHLGRKFASAPVLNQSFTDCDPTKRIFAEQTQHPCWMQIQHRTSARRIVSKNQMSRVI